MSDHKLAVVQLSAVALTFAAWWWQHSGLPWFKEWIRKVVREGNENDESQHHPQEHH